jgi:hypothetical protein
VTGRKTNSFTTRVRRKWKTERGSKTNGEKSDKIRRVWRVSIDKQEHACKGPWRTHWNEHGCGSGCKIKIKNGSARIRPDIGNERLLKLTRRDWVGDEGILARPKVRSVRSVRLCRRMANLKRNRWQSSPWLNEERREGQVEVRREAERSYFSA